METEYDFDRQFTQVETNPHLNGEITDIEFFGEQQNDAEFQQSNASISIPQGKGVRKTPKVTFIKNETGGMFDAFIAIPKEYGNQHW